jgi:hypothetical protein
MPCSARPERRAQHDLQERERRDEQHEHAVVNVRRVAEVERDEAADRSDGLEVHADAIRAAAELRVVENEVEHLREC